MALNEQFIHACETGDLNSIREIYMLFKLLDISADDEDAFRTACYNGHVEVVRQLYEWKPTIDLSKCNQYRPLLLFIGITLPNPLTKESIAEGETLQCSICMDIIQSECMVTKCGHKYCEKCIIQWLENNSSCPYCRAPI